MKSLKGVLQINAGFSTFSGLAMLIGSGLLARVFGLMNGIPFLVIGIGLILFGGFVFFTSKKQLNNRKLVQQITGLDALWVLGSLAIVVFQLFGLSSTGYITITVVMVIIAYFAISQYRLTK